MQYDKALDLFEQALSQDPQDPAYQLGARRLRFQASQEHVDAGVKLRKDGKLEQALTEFQRAFTIDPGSAVALQEIQHTSDLLDQVRRGAVPPGQVPMTDVEKARKESLAMIKSLLPVPELKPITNKIPQLKMNNQPPGFCTKRSASWPESMSCSIRRCNPAGIRTWTWRT